MLIVVSGPDRVGKSTLICRMQEACGNDAYVAHHSAPPKNQKNIFDFYRDDIEKWQDSGKIHFYMYVKKGYSAKCRARMGAILNNLNCIRGFVNLN